MNDLNNYFGHHSSIFPPEYGGFAIKLRCDGPFFISSACNLEIRFARVISNCYGAGNI